MDPYIYPNSTLVNKFDIQDPEELKILENRFTQERIRKISTNGPQGPFTYERLKATHHYIFQDIYEWAGKPRVVSMAKLVHYLPHQQINNEAKKLFDWVAKQREFKDLKTDQFINEISEFWAKAYYIHPFREGNTRSLSAFTYAMANEAGYKLNFDVISPSRMLEVSSRSILGDMSGIRKLFVEVLDEKKVERLRSVQTDLEKQKFDWKNTYISTSEPGKRYEGNLIGRGKEEFMIQLNDGRLIIGKIADFPKDNTNQQRISFIASQEGTILVDKTIEYNSKKSPEPRKQR